MKKNKSKVLFIIFAFALFIGGKVYAVNNGWLNITWNSVPAENFIDKKFDYAIREDAIESYEQYAELLKPQANTKPKIINGTEVSSDYPEVCFSANENPTVLYEKVGAVIPGYYSDFNFIDLRLTISDAVLAENPTSDDLALVCFKADSIGFTMREVKQVNWKIEYYFAGTNIPFEFLHTMQKISNVIDGKYIGFENEYKNQTDVSYHEFSYTEAVSKTMKYSDDIAGFKYLKNDFSSNNSNLGSNVTKDETAFIRYMNIQNTDWNEGDVINNDSGVFGTESDNISENDFDFEIRVNSHLPKIRLSKSVKDENEDNFVQSGEKITYYIDVTSDPEYETWRRYVPPYIPNDFNLWFQSVPIRDSFLENIPEYFTFNNDIKVYDISLGGNEEIFNISGDLTKGDFKINEYITGATYRIVYSFTATETMKLPASDIINKATDNGSDPLLCETISIDCGIAKISAKPEAMIKKNVKDANEDNIVQPNELLTYQIEIENTTLDLLKNSVDSTTNLENLTDNGILYNVTVRDDLIEKTPAYLIFNNDVKVYDITNGKKNEIKDYTGSLTDGSFVLDKIPNGSTYMLEYTFKASDTIGKEIEKVTNKATDNGSNPADCTTNTNDCAIATLDVKPDSGTTEDVITPKENNKIVTNADSTNRTILLPRTGMNLNNIFYILIISSTLLIVRKKVIK